MLKKQSNKLILVMLAFLFVVALTACSEPTQTGTNDAEPTEKGVVETEKTDTAEADTRIFQAVNGEIEVPANPERVVVVASSYVGYFLALDLTPVGISEKALNNPYFAGKVEGIASVGDEISVKTILALDPDLIISFHVPESVEQLEKIAPTVAIEYGKKDLREQLRDFGTLTGREEKAEAWIAEWDKKIAEHKTKVNEAVGDQTVSILQPYAKGIYAFGHSYARGGEIIYGEFGLKAPEPIQTEVIDSGKGWGDLSLEVLPEYAGDYIFTSAWSGDDSDPEVVYSSTIWQGLPAVKNHRVFKLDPQSSFYNDPVSLEAQLEFFVTSLTK